MTVAISKCYVRPRFLYTSTKLYASLWLSPLVNGMYVHASYTPVLSYMHHYDCRY